MGKLITKAVIPAAGYGTRMLPVTKAISKEVLPLVDKPIIQVVVENLVAAGIEDIIIVTKVRKSELVEYFGDVDRGLVEHLRSSGPAKAAILEQLEGIRELANFAFVEQERAHGTGIPVLDAAPYIGDSPFIYTFADDFFLGERNDYEQIIEAYEQYKVPVLACQRRTADEDYDRYGYVGGDELAPDLVSVKAIAEHPGKEHTPGDLASLSSFVVTPEVLPYLRAARAELQPGQELYFHAAFGLMLQDGKQLIAKEITNADFFDTGDKLEYMKTAVALAARHPEIGEQFKQFLTQFTQKEE